MAQGEGFKHITVTAADEEDVVVHAGLSQVNAPSSPQESGDAPQAADAGRMQTDDSPAKPLPEEENAAAGAPSKADAPKTDDASPQVGAPRANSASAATGKRRSNAPTRKDDYREATLADLQPQPMPLAQRIVIIAAVVCIIGAVLYYFVAMG